MKAVLKTRHIFVTIAVAALVTTGAAVAYFATRQDNRTNPNVIQKMSQTEFAAQKQLLEQELRRKGAAGMISLLKQEMAGDASVARECHPLLHHMGHAAYQHYGSFAEAMAHQDEFCNSGFTHGIIEAAFLESDDWLETMQLACPSSDTNKYRQWQCYHGVGHGVMYAQGRDEVKSLAVCETLPSDAAKDSCVNGVFMEKFIVVDHMGKRRKNTPDYSFCRTQPAKYKPDCYLYAPTAYLQRNLNAYDQAFRRCNDVEAGYKNICADGTAGQAMKDNISRPAIVAEICKRVDPRFRIACAQGAISLYMHHHASSEKGARLCENEFETFRPACEIMVQNKKKLLGI